RPRREFQLPPRDRATHGTTVREQLEQARVQNEQQRAVTSTPNEPAPIILAFRGEPGSTLKLDSLEDKTKGIEVACVRTEGEEDGEVQVAVVHVPEGALTHFLKRVEEYLTKDTNKGNPKNQD